MKRTLSTILASTMAFSLFASLPAFANGEETTQPPQPTYLFSADFENDTVGSAPSNFYKDDSTNKFTYADENKVAVSKDYAFISKDNTHGNYLELASTTPQQWAKAFLSEAVDASDGTIVIEYDGLINIKTSGNDSRKYMYATITGQNKDRTSINTQNSELLNNKGSDVGNAYGFNELVHKTDGTVDNRYKESYDGRVDKDGNQTKNSRLLYYYNDTVKNKYENESNCIKRVNNTWQHYKMELDLTKGTQQLWIDGKASEIWQDKNLHAKVKWEGFSIDAISFSSYGDSSNPNWLLDNIKVYKKNDNNSAFVAENPITQDSETGVVTAKFKYAMDSSAIRLYDADGTDVTKLVTMSDDSKTAIITPNASKTKGLYYVKVGNYSGQTYGPAVKEQTVQLNWEGEPRTYLYYEDFENDTVDNAPNSFYDGESDSKYSDKENSVKADKTKVAVKNDSEKGNYAEIITSNEKQAKIFLDREVSRADGTVVLELDIKSKLNGDWYNCEKEILYQKSAKDASNNDTTSSALWFKGSDKGNPFGFNESIYTKKSDKDEDRWDGTNESRFLMYYNDNDNDSKILRTEDWQHYKLELNMKTGEQQLWLDGKASEIWLDKDLYASVAIEDYKLNGFVFKARYGGTGTATNLQLDNIKVYLKDTADTSPFESITSEKNGNVVAKFGYAVNAEDLAVYNADGEKISGSFAMSDDNKTATFTPVRSEADGLYYVQVAKLASGKVTPQTTKEFNYAPGRTTMVISDLNAVIGSVAPKFTLTHTDGEAKDVVMIVAAYKGGKMVKADVKTKTLTEAEINGVEVEGAPTLTLTDGEADTVKAFAWIGGTYVPIGQSAVYSAGN